MTDNLTTRLARIRALMVAHWSGQDPPPVEPHTYLGQIWALVDGATDAPTFRDLTVRCREALLAVCGAYIDADGKACVDADDAAAAMARAIRGFASRGEFWQPDAVVAALDAARRTDD